MLKSTTLQLFLAILPILSYSQIIDHNFICHGHKFIDRINDENSYLDEESTSIVVVILTDPYKGTLQIKDKAVEVKRQYALVGEEGLINENINLWIFDNSTLEGDSTYTKYNISIYKSHSKGYGIIIDNNDETLEQYYNMQIVDD